MTPNLWIIVLAIALLPIWRRACGGRSRCMGSGFPIVLLCMLACGGVAAYLWSTGATRSSITTMVWPSGEVKMSTSRSARSASVKVMAGPATTQSDKAWLEDWQQFTNSTGFRGFRAESSDICASEADARNEAIASARETLYKLVSTNSAIRGNVVYKMLSPQLLQQQIAARLESGEFITDQFVRRTEKPYGTLWKVYLLVDTSEPNITSIVRDFRAVATANANRQLTTWSSLGALTLVIVLLYAFLNAVTKGYFVWRLRAVAMLIMIVALLVVMAMV